MELLAKLPLVAVLFISINNNVVKMQLDIDISPPANDITFRLGLTHVTFDLDPRDL